MDDLAVVDRAGPGNRRITACVVLQPTAACGLAFDVTKPQAALEKLDGHPLQTPGHRCSPRRNRARAGTPAPGPAAVVAGHAPGPLLVRRGPRTVRHRARQGQLADALA